MMMKPKLGTGQRFSALSSALAREGANDPDALASVIGRKKFGKKKMVQMAAAGRMKH